MSHWHELERAEWTRDICWATEAKLQCLTWDVLWKYCFFLFFIIIIISLRIEWNRLIQGIMCRNSLPFLRRTLKYVFTLATSFVSSIFVKTFQACLFSRLRNKSLQWIHFLSRKMPERKSFQTLSECYPYNKTLYWVVTNGKNVFRFFFPQLCSLEYCSCSFIYPFWPCFPF